MVMLLVIPPAAGYVALTGQVELPAIYEIRGAYKTQFKAFWNWQVGVPVVADPRRAFIERIDPGKSVPRTIEDFVIDENGVKKALKSGDLITILPIKPKFPNVVTLRGTFYTALRIPYREGMRITDLIPSKGNI